MAGNAGSDRRRTPSDLRLRPRSSPANLLVLTVVGVLAATAAAAVLFGTGFDETTPHGQVLTTLQRVAEAQEEHHRRTGEFAPSLHLLDLQVPDEVIPALMRVDGDRWEAMASHPAGLSCVQGGILKGRQLRRDPPTCYTAPTD
jgi:hypothetical protein